MTSIYLSDLESYFSAQIGIIYPGTGYCTHLSDTVGAQTICWNFWGEELSSDMEEPEGKGNYCLNC